MVVEGKGKRWQNAVGRVPLRPARLTTCPTEGSGLRPIQSRFSLHDVPYPQQNRFSHSRWL